MSAKKTLEKPGKLVFLKNNKHLFLITLSYFVLGLVNIHFALLAFICMALPLVMLFYKKKKAWCQGYCPRACLYTAAGNMKKWKHLPTPQFFITGAMKWILLGYFCISLFFIIFSTFMVASGRREALEAVRFLIFIPIGKLPQLLPLTTPQWLLHMSYRFYSMMLTTTSIGFLMALIYKPRTWCTVCPIATVSGLYLKSIKK